MKRKSRFEKMTKRILILTVIVFCLGFVGLNSYESTVNINSQNIEKEIATLESDIDGLNMKKQELASFTRVSSIASKKGYTYQQNSSTAAVVGVERE